MPLISGQPRNDDDSGRSPLQGTAARIFIIMLLVLLPLAVSAIISNWIAIRTAEREKAELMQTATQQNARQLAADIGSIRTSLSLTANVLADDPQPGNICERLQQLFLSMAGPGGIESAIYTNNGDAKCRSAKNGNLVTMADRGPATGSEVILSPGLDGILVSTRSRDGTLFASALYKREALQRLTSSRDPHQAVALRQRGQQLLLSAVRSERFLDAARAPVGDTGIEFVMTVKGDGASTQTISLLMPLLMWFTAALLSWLVVRSILIKPLIALRREVASYRPGKIMVPPRTAKLASSEIVELGAAFQAMSEDVAEHEQEMREALDRQTKLTREIHHRVKNNLQIISSLVSLHWRAAGDPQSAAAYISIQRRVDALAVVQRNHYAELDEHLGVRARPMMNEIASGLKTSAQVQNNRNLDIGVDCDDVCLHQDVAAPIAFMTAELADLAIALDADQKLEISLVRSETDMLRAKFAVASPAFRKVQTKDTGKVELYERILSGLARQLRTPLEHSADRSEYFVVIPLTA